MTIQVLYSCLVFIEPTGNSKVPEKTMPYASNVAFWKSNTKLIFTSHRPSGLVATSSCKRGWADMCQSTKWDSVLRQGMLGFGRQLAVPAMVPLY